MSKGLLDELLTRVSSMPPEDIAAAVEATDLATGDMVWIPQPGPQTEAFLCEADELYYGGEAGGGKLQAIDNKVLTPTGWEMIGNMKIGSKLCATDGTVTEVIGVYPQGIVDLYRVTMNDGGSTEAGMDHNWLAWKTHGNRKKSNIRTCGAESARKWTTRQIIAEIEKGRRPDGRARRIAIPVSAPVSFNVAGKLVGKGNFVGREIDPYLLGLILGDGWIGKKNIKISSADQEIEDYLLSTSSGGVAVDPREGSAAKSYRFRGRYLVEAHKALERLGLINHHSWDKFIPRQYLFAPIKDRWSLLQGLMDTDGWAEEKKGVYFCTVSERLRDDVSHLAQSLGAIVSVTNKKPTYTYLGKKLNGRPAFTLYMKFKDPTKCFRLSRKIRVAQTVSHQSEGRIIDKIEFSRRAEAVCIQVAHPNSLYITDDFIVTHNTDLLIGLALHHTNSLLLRRVGKEAYKLMTRVEEILGNIEGRNLSVHDWKRNDGKLEFAGCEHEDDKQRFKGIPHDLKGFDEIGDFSEGQFRFIKNWNRSSKPGQRSRVVATGNPPTNPEGLWVIEYWAPWLDPRHPNPAKSGELRWFISDEETGKDKEVPGPGVYPLIGEDGHQRQRDDGTPDTVIARSRTFIRARLSDNKYLGDDYAAVLDSLPKELRAAYRDGRFDMSLKDNMFQTIPTAWVMAAIERRRKRPKHPPGIPMCAIGCDPTGGGSDEFTMAPRFDGWYADIIAIPAKLVPLGSDMAAQIVKTRRDKALPIVDCGGGYGGGVIQTLGENEIDYKAYKGSEGVSTRDKSGKLKFKNQRSEAIWRFREALDPDQEGGSIIELPDDPRMIADLTAPTFKVTNGCIVVESKEDVCARLRRSTDRGDSVVMAWVSGLKGIEIAGGWDEFGGSRKKTPNVVMGHARQRRIR